MAVALSTAEFDLLAGFASRVRVFLAEQAPAPCERLLRYGLIEAYRVWLPPMLNLVEPVYRSEGGMPFNAYAIEHILDKRWNKPLIPTTVLRMSKRGSNLLGLPMPRTVCSQLIHDLHVASLYLLHTSNTPRLELYTEDELRNLHVLPPRSKVPDLGIVESDVLTRVVEFGGRYRAKRLIQLDTWCARMGVPYDLW